MHGGRGRQRQCDRAAEAQAADVAAAPHHHPARTGGKGSDPERGAHGIDDEQYEDDAEASERRPGEVGRIEPSAAVGQARQQQRDADAAFGERHDEGDRRRPPAPSARSLLGHHAAARTGSTIIAPTPDDREPRGVAREFHSDPFGSVAGRVVVDLHRAAGQPEHRERNRGERKMIIQHDAEEARYQDLVGQRGGGQDENCEIMATVNPGYGSQDRALFVVAPTYSGCASTRSRILRVHNLDVAA